MKVSLLISSLFLCVSTFGQDTLKSVATIDTLETKPVSDSLSTYQFPDFRDMDTSMRSTYDFVDYSKNNYQFYSKESRGFEAFYDKMSSLIENKKGKMNLYHIGGSHLQADIYTHDVRTYLQTRWEGVTGERGWVFPFDLAKTNNPGNYEFSSPNTWKPYRSVVQKPHKVNIDYGILGCAVTCPDSAIIVKFKHDRTTVKPPIQRLRIYHNVGEFPYSIHFGVDELLVDSKVSNLEEGWTEIHFTDPVDTLNIQFARLGYHAPELELHGFLMMNDEPGFSYTAIGVNGAGLYTYLKNIRFEEQLKAYPPDFFAYSVGTNDGNVPYADFKPEVYKANLEKMMQMALRANPDVALLLTVPNDSYYRRRYLNRNIGREREMIIELAKEYDMAVWDLYGVMGELGSSKTWKLNGLMRSDLIHFTHPGYHFKGDLYIDGLLKFMDQFELKKETAKTEEE
ncbi:MAG: GDSL-type esterase/lipase family protein [Crocinitomicaceae bacterium]|nr:GDSL-type esterase/lipase family protein [Crocinitomicaceae bacterium]